MKNRDALIIFARVLEKGAVKTRLAASIGDDAALAVYSKLLQHTHDVTCNLSCDKYVFYADHIPNSDMWDKGYSKQLQQGANLGERMRAAFSQVFQQGYSRVLLIGSDCLELTTPVLEQAFLELEENEIAIGPAQDGGYYLIGMKDRIKEVFGGVAWSTEKVWQQTKERIVTQGYSYGVLPVLRDVDTVDDLPKELLLRVQATLYP
ncbi:MAG TPA: TIGR04282 family arsenosugar biosynthesis glycosyltransferase [Flavisolibacter sp.]|nr:TIGR04282 family arsenosugar biosynthesis glycosyltransferase [Flavisolibacter sp.]